MALVASSLCLVVVAIGGNGRAATAKLWPLFALFLSAFVSESVLYLCGRREARRFFQEVGTDFCPHCVYIRRGLTEDRPCPECGQPYDKKCAEAIVQAWTGIVAAPGRTPRQDGPAEG